MKVSIITVCFNSEKTILDTFASIRDQSYSDIEYIVIDGGSNDGTLSIINANSDIISHWISEPDEGLYHAMNKGLAAATGDIVGFINSDDFLHDGECISDIVKCFREQSAEVVYGDKIYVRASNPSVIVRYWVAGQFDRNKYRTGWMTPHLSTYIKRELYDRHGGFDTSYRIAADYELMYRLFVKNFYRVAYLPRPISTMREGGLSNGSIRNICISNYEVYRALRKHGEPVSPLIMILKPLSKIFQRFRMGK